MRQENLYVRSIAVDGLLDYVKSQGGDVPAIARVDILTFADAEPHGRPMNLGVNARAAWHFTATALLEVQIEFDLGHLGILVMTVSLQGSRYDLTPVKPNHRLHEYLI